MYRRNMGRYDLDLAFLYDMSLHMEGFFSVALELQTLRLTSARCLKNVAIVQSWVGSSY